MGQSDQTNPKQSRPPHTSVMPKEVQGYLNLKPGDTAVDATVGAGGHALETIQVISPGGHLIACDVDPVALGLAENRIKAAAEEAHVKLDFVKTNFSCLSSSISGLVGPNGIQGILADLGVSSMQLDTPERGFSFQSDAPLDMRMDPDLPDTAADLLLNLSEEEIADTLFYLGGERGSRRIASRIVRDRDDGHPPKTTAQLEKLVRSALRVRGHKRIHPATRTFQALRMKVNMELEVLESFIEEGPEILAVGGVLAFLTFHSGEDRLVKHGFKALDKTGRFRLLKKSVLKPQKEECAANRRSRSAKLRGLQRI